MLRNITINDLGGGINLIDIGARGGCSDKWHPIQKMINFYGFEPDENECERLNAQTTGFNTSKCFPYAIAGYDGEATLYITKNDVCCSLLKPRTDWLRRFKFADDFEIIGEKNVKVNKLNSIPEINTIDVDCIKLDTQGLELPILANAGAALKNAFYVETETGFTENYIGETTYSQIDEFMRANDYLLFDINPDHRVRRKYLFERVPGIKAQMMWCEAVWLKDYIALEQKGIFNHMTRAKALKALMICALEGSFDFGYEIAGLFCKKQLITNDEFVMLKDEQSWRI